MLPKTESTAEAPSSLVPRPISSFPNKPHLKVNPVREAGEKVSVLHDPAAYKARMRELLWPIVPSSFLSATPNGQPNPDFRPHQPQRVSATRAHELITLSKRLKLEEMSIAPPQHEPAPGTLARRLVQLHDYTLLGEHGDDEGAASQHVSAARRRQSNERLYKQTDPRRRIAGVTVVGMDPRTVGLKKNPLPSSGLRSPTLNAYQCEQTALTDNAKLESPATTGLRPFSFVSKTFKARLEERAEAGHLHSNIGSGSRNPNINDFSFSIQGFASNGTPPHLSTESLSPVDEVKYRKARFIRQPLATTVVNQEQEERVAQLFVDGATEDNSMASQTVKRRKSSRRSTRTNDSSCAGLDNDDGDVIILLTPQGPRRSTAAALKLQRIQPQHPTVGGPMDLGSLTQPGGRERSRKEELEQEAAAVFAMASGKQRLLFRPPKEHVMSHHDAILLRDAAMHSDSSSDYSDSNEEKDESGGRFSTDKVPLKQVSRGSSVAGKPNSPDSDIRPSPQELAGFLFHSMLYDPRLPRGSSVSPLAFDDGEAGSLSPHRDVQRAESVLIPTQPQPPAAAEIFLGGPPKANRLLDEASMSPRVPLLASGSEVPPLGSFSMIPPDSARQTPSAMEALASSLRRAESQARMLTSSSRHGANAMRRLMSMRSSLRSQQTGEAAEHAALAAAKRVQRAQWEAESVRLLTEGDASDAPPHTIADCVSSRKTSEIVGEPSQTFGVFAPIPTDAFFGDLPVPDIPEVLEGTVRDNADTLEFGAFAEEAANSAANGPPLVPFADAEGAVIPQLESIQGSPRVESQITVAFLGGVDGGDLKTPTRKGRRDSNSQCRNSTASTASGPHGNGCARRYVITAPGMATPVMYFTYAATSLGSDLHDAATSKVPCKEPTYPSASPFPPTRSFVIPISLEDCVVGGVMVEYRPHQVWNGEVKAFGGAKVPEGAQIMRARSASPLRYLHGAPRLLNDPEEAEHPTSRPAASAPRKPVPTWFRNFTTAMKALDTLHKARGAAATSAAPLSCNGSRPTTTGGKSRRHNDRRRRAKGRGGSARGERASRGSSRAESLACSTISSNPPLNSDDDDGDEEGGNVGGPEVNKVYDLPKMVRCSPQRTSSARGEVSTRSVLPVASRIEIHMQQTANALAKLMRSRDVSVELHRANRADSVRASAGRRRTQQDQPLLPNSNVSSPRTSVVASTSPTRRKGSPTRDLMMASGRRPSSSMQSASSASVLSVSLVRVPNPETVLPSSPSLAVSAVVGSSAGSRRPPRPTQTLAQQGSTVMSSTPLSTLAMENEPRITSHGVHGSFGASRKTAAVKHKDHRRDWTFRCSSLPKAAMSK